MVQDGGIEGNETASRTCAACRAAFPLFCGFFAIRYDIYETVFLFIRKGKGRWVMREKTR